MAQSKTEKKLAELLKGKLCYKQDKVYYPYGIYQPFSNSILLDYCNISKVKNQFFCNFFTNYSKSNINNSTNLLHTMISSFYFYYRLDILF